MELAQHTFVVTGGSSGLGAACVGRLLARGANVAILDLKPPSADLSDRALYQRTDVTNEAAVNQTLRRATERFGPVHGLIACAGIIHAERGTRAVRPVRLERLSSRH